jgi:hypothetical protein
MCSKSPGHGGYCGGATERSVQRLAIALAILTLICGLRAARLWKRSSEVIPEPEGVEPVDKTLRQMWWQSATMKASERSTTLNKQAARWTAAAVVFGCLTILAGY